MMNRELARIARIHGKVGYLSLRARFVPQAVKGRRAHPPKAERVWLQRINKKEMRLAIKSALAATLDKRLVSARGHKSEKEPPIIIVDDFENVKKTKEAESILEKVIGNAEMERAKEKKVRAGVGKLRGRKYRKKKGPLIILSKECNALKSSRNIPGVDVTSADSISIEHLAPGAHAGRLTVITKSALQKLEELYAN
jgi:large subunit ribosomal protein L4e